MLSFCEFCLLVLYFKQDAFGLLENAVHRVADHVQPEIVLVEAALFGLLSELVVKLGHGVSLVDLQNRLQKQIALLLHPFFLRLLIPGLAEIVPEVYHCGHCEAGLFGLNLYRSRSRLRVLLNLRRYFVIRVRVFQDQLVQTVLLFHWMQV